MVTEEARTGKAEAQGDCYWIPNALESCTSSKLTHIRETSVQNPAHFYSNVIQMCKYPKINENL